jgi:hypothetical protein
MTAPRFTSSCLPFSGHDIERLRKLWEDDCAPMEQIEAAFPDRTELSIRKQAQIFGFKRPPGWRARLFAAHGPSFQRRCLACRVPFACPEAERRIRWTCDGCRAVRDVSVVEHSFAGARWV